jgi:hypothetical protein
MLRHQRHGSLFILGPSEPVERRERGVVITGVVGITGVMGITGVVGGAETKMLGEGVDPGFRLRQICL